MKKTFNKPDLNAPRYRPCRMNFLTNALYKKFEKRFPEHKGLGARNFKEIVDTFNGKLQEGIIENRGGVELPEGLGYIFLGSCPATRKQNIDIKKSLQYGIVVNHKNWDSDNYLLKIFYTNQNSKYPFHSKQIWSFKASKSFRKKASDVYKDNWPKYEVIDPQKKISELFAKYRKRDYIQAKSKIVPEGYNEFKM